MLGIGVSLRYIGSAIRARFVYVLFIPFGSDSLITADNLTFKVKE